MISYLCLFCLTLAASSQGPRRNSLLVARTLSRSSNTSRKVVAWILLRPISLLSVWWLSNRATDWPGYADPRRHLSCRLPRRCSTNKEPDLPEPLQIMHKNWNISLPDESHRRDRTSMMAGFQDWEKRPREVPRLWAPRIVGTRSSPLEHYKRWKAQEVYLDLSRLWG